MSYFRKVLIANRGEIAVRLIRACRELGITAVAVYSEADAHALHVRLADEAYLIGPAPAAQSYLRVDAILDAARRSGAEAIHPGYGFLSERAHFARACAESGIVFVGPPATAIDLLGSKIAAKQLAVANDVPVVPGYDGDDQQPATLREAAEQIGFPLLIKASAGGGGKGMRAVQQATEFDAALEGARREALAAFGDEAILLERMIERPRHVEFQVFADDHGNVLHFGERECSIQRRHQKIVEESPCVALDDRLRGTMGAAAVRLARAAGYRNAGTVEFMVDAAGHFYFLEMNTRLQVEHPVTEAVTGYDLVHLQLAVAAGEPLPMRQENIQLRGHAIEARIYAEDPISFLPQIGPVREIVVPEGPGIRNDGGLQSGDDVSIHYDPMIAKLSVYAPDRAWAIGRMRRALDDYGVLGLTTNLALLRSIVAEQRFIAGETHTGFLDEMGPLSKAQTHATPPEVLVAATMAIESQSPPGSDPFARLWRAGGDVRGLRLASRDGALHTVGLRDRPGGIEAQVDEEAFIVVVAAQRGSDITLRFGTRSERFLVETIGATIQIQWRGTQYLIRRQDGLSIDQLGGSGATAHGNANLEAPMSGTIIKVLIEEGQAVAAGEALIVLEAMKMEHTITAPNAGTIGRIHVRPGQLAPGGAVLVEMR